MMTRNILGISLGILLLAGCGGASGGGGSTTAAKTEGGKVVKTVEGEAVTQKAYTAWQKGVAAFTNYDKQGWNEDRCDETIEHFEEADEEQTGSFPKALYMAGVTASRCGHQNDALNYYNRALKAAPKLCGARSAIGLDHLEKGRISQAEGVFKRALKDDPRCTEAYVNLAVIQRERGGKDMDEARKNLRRALAIDSSYLPAFNELALVFYQAARSGEGQELDLAEIVCRQAQLLDTSYAPVYNTWGLIKMQRGDIIEALRLFAKARELDDDMFQAHMNFGEITLSFRGYQDAQSAFKRAVALQPKHYEANLGLGAALRGLEQYDQAKELYEKAMSIDASRPESYFNLGILYQDYMDGQLKTINTAESYLKQFIAKAGNARKYAETVEGVTRRCRLDKQGRPMRRDCRMGRFQQIEEMRKALKMMEEMESMQREQERQMREQQGGGG